MWKNRSMQIKGLECHVLQLMKTLINAVMNLDSESKTPENKSSDKEIITVKKSWNKAANMYSTLLQFAKSWPCYSAQEVMQLCKEKGPVKKA